MRDVVLQEGARAAGVQSDVMMWRNRKRTRAWGMPLTVGLMVDISGSMGDAVEPMAWLTWMMNYACGIADVRSCTTLFGDRAYLYARPGERLRNEYKWFVPVAGHERFSQGFLMLNQKLEMISEDRSSGQILIIASDGHFVVPEERDSASEIMTLCRRSGIEVLWVPFANSEDVSHSGDVRYGYGERVDFPAGADVKALTDVMSNALLAAFSRLHHTRGVAHG